MWKTGKSKEEMMAALIPPFGENVLLFPSTSLRPNPSF